MNKLEQFNDLQKFRRILNTFGYIIPTNAEFYIVKHGEEWHKGLIGMKVGGYTHSCHVDSTNYIVLFFCDDDGKTRIGKYDDYLDIEKLNENH